MKIARGRSVELAYELKVKGGAVIESSTRSGPLRYVHGDGKMLPGLEKRLEGLEPGDERQGEIPAAEAFGTEDSLPVKEMARSVFPAGPEDRAGRRLRGEGSCFRGSGPLQDPLRRAPRRPTSACFTRWSDATSSTGSPSSPFAIPAATGGPPPFPASSSSTPTS